MSKSVEKASEAGQDEAESASVFDFLYHDSRRIASFLSQFDNNGLLTGLTQSESASRGAKRSKRIGIGGNAPLVGGGNLELEIGPGEVGAEGLERVYDPYWANALAFLDVLEERGLLQRDIQSARMGQFVLASGTLVMSDLKMIQAVWSLPSIRNIMIKSFKEAQRQEQDEDNPDEPEPQNRHAKRAAQSKARKSPKAPKDEIEIPDELAITMEMLPHMPHGGQMHLVDGDMAVWAPVSDGCLVTPMSELILKHGQKVAGDWSMVGILDALPFEQGELLSPLEMIQVGLIGDNLSKLALSLASPLRQIMGRPLLSYGITPLLVFREVAP